MLTDMELNNMDEAIKAIGKAKSCFMQSTLDDVRNVLLEKGYKGAEEYAEHLTGEAYTELTRVLIICEEHHLGPEAAAKVIENLNRIESGRWSDAGKTNADARSNAGTDVDKFRADMDKGNNEIRSKARADVEKARADIDKTNAKVKSKVSSNIDKIKADIGKSKVEEDAPYVNECQFKGHEPEEKAADAKAKMLLTRSDVKGKCE